MESALSRKDALSAIGCTVALFSLIGLGLMLNESQFQETVRQPAAQAALAPSNEAASVPSASAGASGSSDSSDSSAAASKAMAVSASDAVFSPRGSDRLKEAQVAREFVARWFASTNSVTSSNELTPYYAARVDYFDRGKLTAQQVLADKANFLRRWPERHYQVIGSMAVTPDEAGGLDVSFPYEYRVSDSEQTRQGRAMARVVVKAAERGLVIVGETGR